MIHSPPLHCMYLVCVIRGMKKSNSSRKWYISGGNSPRENQFDSYPEKEAKSKRSTTCKNSHVTTIILPMTRYIIMHKSPPDVCTSPWARHHTWVLAYWYGSGQINMHKSSPDVCTSPWARHHLEGVGAGLLVWPWHLPIQGTLFDLLLCLTLHHCVCASITSHVREKLEILSNFRYITLTMMEH